MPDSRRLRCREEAWSANFKGRLGRPLFIYEQLPSSMDLLASLAEKGAPSGSLVLADWQAKGRGRLGRVWHSLPGSSLLAALLLRPRWSPERAGVFSLGAGLALLRALRAFDLELEVKWPNDVLWRGKKLAGILTEARLGAGGYRSLILGLGVNVHQRQGDFPLEIAETAISLDMAAGGRLDRGEVLAAWLVEMEAILNALDEGRDEKIIQAWREVWPHRGLSAHDEDGRELLIRDVTPSGGLKVEGPEGPEILNAGDVSILF